MKDRREHKRMRQSVGFRKIACERYRFLDPREGALGLADEPETPASEAPHGHARVERIDEDVVGILTRIVQRQRAVEMFQGETKVTLMRARNLHCPVASHSDTGIGDALGEPQELAGYSRSGRQLGFQRVEGP